MPKADYLRITIGEAVVETTEADQLPISINYSLEDSANFQSKQSSNALDIEIPATLMNSKIANTYHNPSVEDLTQGQVFRNIQRGIIEESGTEIVVGKAFLRSAKFSNLPISYTYNILGDNVDWLVGLKDASLYDFLKDITFTFDEATVKASWNADGVNRLYRYVFAPVRYRDSIGG
jgi:hypothetical protein